MSVKPSPGRRRVQMFDSDDDELVIESSDIEARDDQTIGEGSHSEDCESRAETPFHDSSKSSSILTSTPRSSSKVSSFLFPDDDNTSAILSESMENLSLQKSEIQSSVSSDKWESADHERSRSFNGSPDKSDVMSPISKKLSQAGDKASTQKLRERLLRKSVMGKKTGGDRQYNRMPRMESNSPSQDIVNCSDGDEECFSADGSAMSPMSSRTMSPMNESLETEQSITENSLQESLVAISSGAEESCQSDVDDVDRLSLSTTSKDVSEKEDLSEGDSCLDYKNAHFSDQENMKSTDSIICLSSDSETEPEALHNSVEVLSSGSEPIEAAGKEKKLNGPSDYLLVKYCNDSTDQLRNKLRLAKHTLATIPGTSMKDGGEKLRLQVADLTCILNYREKSEVVAEKLSGDKPIFRGPQVIEPTQARFTDDMYDRLYTNDTKRLFGGKMTDNRLDRVERVTENALKGMHNAISSVPEEHQIIESPEGLKVDLMYHQKQGLAWLTWRETQRPPCGILADDMGLGKTLSMISLVLNAKNQLQKKKDEGDLEEYNKRRQAAKNNGYVPSNATLVVAPASLIYQWEQEVQRRVHDGRLRVAVFHGPKNKRESDPIRLARNDIVITTYNLLTTELTEKIITGNNEDQYSTSDDDDDDDNWGDQAAVTKDKKPKNKISKNSSSVLAKICWARIILDEAHQIKNKNTGASKAACRLASTARWCLTGTPIHNNLWDLYSLIRFMRVSPFDEEKHWKEYIMSSTKKAADRLNLLVKNLLLRRTKTQTNALTNKPLVDLQPKVFKKHDLVLEGIEAQVYDIMFTATQQKVKQMLSEADTQRHVQLYGFARRKADGAQEMKNPFNFGPRTIGAADKFQQMSCMLVMLLRLRQACVHLHLTKEAVDMDAFEHLGGDEKDADDLLEQTMANLTLDEDNTQEISTSAVFERDYMSCKVKKLMEIVDDVMNLGDKIVVVSQWTSLLDIVERQIKLRAIRYTSITGKVAPADRQERVDSFNKEKGGARVMLLSLTAGGVGLNLIGGNHLVMVDLHWNPALEAQACDRIYRMGQKKTVYIHRLIASGTIEQRVVHLQEKKLELAGSVLEGAASRKMNKLTMADLRFLFDLDRKEAPQMPTDVPSGSRNLH